MSLLIFLLFIFTIQKEVKEKVMLDFDLLNLSSSYDYHIYTSDSSKLKKKIYFLIETELDSMPFNISYNFRDSQDTFKNVSIYYQEQKGNLTAFFFKLEKPDEKDVIEFNVANIIGEYALFGCSMFEELNSNFIRIEDTSKANKIRIYNSRPSFILFNTANLDDYSFILSTSSFNTIKKNIHIFGSNKDDINDIFILGRDYHIIRESYILYDNKTYELSPIYGTIGFILHKSAFIVLEPLVDEEILIQFKNVSNIPYIFAPYYPSSEIGHHFFENFRYKKIVYPINCTNYYQNLFYFTLKPDGDYNYYYSNDVDSESDVPGALELKNVYCKSKNTYEYCEMNKTSLDQKFFYFIVEGEDKLYNFIEFRSTFFNELNYIIQKPSPSYESEINKNKPNLPIVIGDFEYNKKFYFKLEINFPDNYINDNDNNIKNLDIYVKLLNEEAKNHLTFPLENKDVSLIINLSTENKAYYLYESKDRFSSGVKSMFFFVNHKGKNPNCIIKYGISEEYPIKYENNSIFLNEEKSFNNIYDIFFLSLNLTAVSLLSNDYIYITFEGKKEAFISNKINYKYGSGEINNNINGNYSVCEAEIQESGDKRILSCLIPNKLNQSLSFILYLNKNNEIKVKSEIIYKGNFIESLSLIPNRKYIISNNANNNDNYYIFISFNNNFNLDNITYNTIDSLDNFDDKFHIQESKEIKGFVDKRIYTTINNKDKKAFIGFKIEKITIPFKIIKTKIDESNTQYLYYKETYKFKLTLNNPLLFAINFSPKYGNMYLKLSSNININNFNNLTYFDNLNEFHSFSETEMHKFDENVYKMFCGGNKTVVYKIIYLNNNSNLFGMFINQAKEGELGLEILENFDEIYKLILKDNIPYDMKKGINLINTELNNHSEYNFILKYYNNISSDNIEIYRTIQSDFDSNKTVMDNIPFDILNDINYIYQFFNFRDRPYLIIFYDNSYGLTLRQSKQKENDIIKHDNLGEKRVEVKNTNKINLISGININNIKDDKYYFKYSLDSKYYNQLYSIWYIDDEANMDNIIDFYKREKSNIKPIRYIKYKDIMEIYLETYNLQSTGKKTAIFMFEYYNSNHSLTIDLSASEKSLYTSLYLTKSQNNNYDIINKVFFIDLLLSNFKDDNNTYILFEIKGSESSFNSTKVYINNLNDSQTEIFSDYNNCKESKNANEITILCNYTKNSQNNIRFMLFLNEGNKINIKNIIPQKEESSSGNKSLKLFCYIGIPIIVIAIGVIVAIIIIKRKKKQLKFDESITALTTELE